MKVVLLADGIVGLNITRFLLDQYPEDISIVATTQVNDIFQLVEAREIPVCVFNSADGLLAKLPEAIDLGLLAWWPKIIKNPLLEAPRWGFVNTHPSLLPHNRGKHYNFWALVEQAPFGVTLHLVDSGVDTGAIISQKMICYDWCDTGGSLFAKAQDAMVRLFSETYPALRAGKLNARPQDGEIGSFHRSSEIDEASKVHLARLYRCRDLLNLLRARTFEGHPGCWFEDNGQRYEISIKIKKAD